MKIKEAFGEFTFRNEGNGCLTSVYLEHTASTSYPECAKLIRRRESSLDQYEGTYLVLWSEENNQYRAELTITLIGELYKLEWKNLDSFIDGPTSLEYEGNGHVANGILAGVYWNSRV